MNRRAFFGLIGSAALASAAIDPEKLLWVPGKKLISIPKPRGLTVRFVRGFDIRAFEMIHGIDYMREDLTMPYGVEGIIFNNVRDIQQGIQLIRGQGIELPGDVERTLLYGELIAPFGGPKDHRCTTWNPESNIPPPNMISGPMTIGQRFMYDYDRESWRPTKS